MDDNCLYFDITKQERDSAIRYLLGAILKSRQDGNIPSNLYVYDEDVNIYLAHLLFAVSLSEYHEMAEPYLSTDTSEILNAVRATEDRTIRYFIFKVNADHMLIHTSIFNDMDKNRKKGIFRRSQRHYRELAKLYYDQAAAYHRRIYRKKAGVGEVLEKIAQYYEMYEEILKRVRRDYFSFVNGFRDQAFHHFMEEVRHYEREQEGRTKMDEFLDLYGLWMRTKDPVVEFKIVQMARELRKIDPNFQFDLTQILGNRRYNDEWKCA